MYIPHDDVLAILEIARFAPSVHNTQPWIVTIVDDGIHVATDKKYVLTDGDPTGRETVISLGIFCEAIIQAAATIGYTEHTYVLSPDNQVHISLNKGQSVEKTIDNFTSLLKSRCTDRSIYKPVNLATEVLSDIQNSWSDDMVHVAVITDKTHIETIADLTSHAIRVALSAPGFRKELSEYLTQSWSRKQRGISVSSLYINPVLAACEPVLMRLGFGIKAESKLEQTRWESASALVAITTPGDMSKDWFNAGRAYLHISLAIENAGLSQATSAATVEASNYHEDVEAMIDTTERLQSMIRIGKGARAIRPYSPRVSAKALLAT